MAEGDTILRAAQRIDQAIAGQEVAVTTPNPRGRTSGVARLDGETFEEATAHGKNLFLGFGDLTLHSHLGMSGSWHVYRRGQRWTKPRRSAWAVLRTPSYEVVQFGGPTLRLLRTEKLGRDPQIARLGPDILASDFTPEVGVGSLRSTEPTRTLGDALLNQTLIAGIGNIFKSEGCWAARVDPWRPVGDVTDGELELVVESTQKLMTAAVAQGRAPKRVYRKSRMPCPRCRRAIQSRGQGDDNRTTYWCANCQS